MEATAETPEPHCQYCRASGRLFTINSPGGYASYVCADCFRRMAIAGRSGRPQAQTVPVPEPSQNLLRVDIGQTRPAVLTSA